MRKRLPVSFLGKDPSACCAENIPGVFFAGAGRPSPRRGTALAAVLVVASLAAGVALSLLFFAQAEVATSAVRIRGEQAYAAAISGLQFAVSVLALAPNDPSIWYDNPDLFQNQLVYDDGAEQWYFVVYAENLLDPRLPRYGLSDEAGKLNLNTADEETLRQFAPLPPHLVDRLLDWRDEDEDPRSEGAEYPDHYSHLPQPYLARNGPLVTLEELLLVKGFSGPVLYGDDANLSGILDPNEDDGDDTFPRDDRDGSLNRGLYGLATVWSYEPNRDLAGQRRADLNGDPRALQDLGLSQEVVNFVRLYRAEGRTFNHPADLVHAECEVRQEPRGMPGVRRGDVVVLDPEPGDLPIILDRLTTSRERLLRGLVNVHTAPPEVLAALPGMDANLARQIVDARSALDPQEKTTFAWLYTLGLLDAETFKRVAPRLTARGFQYHVRCIGFGARCRQYRILEAVVDLARGTPRIMYMRDLTRLGLPFALDAEVLVRRG